MRVLWSTNKISRFYKQWSCIEKKVILLPLYFIFSPLPSSILIYSFIISFPFFNHPHHIFSPPLRIEPPTLRVWAWRANHYATPPVQNIKLKMTLINGFSSTFDLLKNYRIFQYFSLIIFTVLAKLSPCLLEISIIQQEHAWSGTFTNSISKFCKFFKVPANYKKLQ